jgi:hypothetical protein
MRRGFALLCIAQMSLLNESCCSILLLPSYWKFSVFRAFVFLLSVIFIEFTLPVAPSFCPFLVPLPSLSTQW